jgi:hypothetical protein
LVSRKQDQGPDQTGCYGDVEHDEPQLLLYQARRSSRHPCRKEIGPSTNLAIPSELGRESWRWRCALLRKSEGGGAWGGEPSEWHRRRPAEAEEGGELWEDGVEEELEGEGAPEMHQLTTTVMEVSFRPEEDKDARNR